MPIKITKVSEETGIDANGRAISNVRVEFTVGPHGPFIERFAKSEFTSAAANQRIQAFATTLAGLNG